MNGTPLLIGSPDAKALWQRQEMLERQIKALCEGMDQMGAAMKSLCDTIDRQEAEIARMKADGN